MTIKLSIASLVFVLTVTSCAPAYVANTKNTPLFTEAKQFSANISYFSGIDLQAAYSFSEHLAAMANGNIFITKTEIYGEPQRKPHHIFGEVGIGYFPKTEDVRVEIFGGYGRGKGVANKSIPEIDEGDFNGWGTYNRIFIQPSIATNEKDFNLIFTPRVSLVEFTKFAVESRYAPNREYRPGRGYRAFFEPSLTGRFDLNSKLRGYAQIGMNVPFQPTYYWSNILQFAVGIQLHLGPSHKDVN